MSQMKVHGHEVDFPFKAYGPQLSFMNKALKALSQGENALLEAPTGSGKTLSLLCSALAWQAAQRARIAEDLQLQLSGAKQQAAGQDGEAMPDMEQFRYSGSSKRSRLSNVSDAAGSPQAAAGPAQPQQGGKCGAAGGCGGLGDSCGSTGGQRTQPPTSTLASDGNADLADRSASTGPRNGPEAGLRKPRKKVPKIYYLTRTHSQIAQVTRELKRTSYRPKMAILGSRQHYCIHKTVARERSVDEGCEKLMQDEGGCRYFSRAKHLSNSSEKLKVHDIEELAVEGRKVGGCPYFAARNFVTDAELIFAPYTYVVDPVIRAAMDIKLEGAVLIFDEGHNIEDVAREAASMEQELDVLSEAHAGLVKADSLNPEAVGPVEGVGLYAPLAGAMRRLTEWLQSTAGSGRMQRDGNASFGRFHCIFSGSQILDELNGIGWGAKEVEALWCSYEEARKQEEKAKERRAGPQEGDGRDAAVNSQGDGCGAGALALGVLSRVLTSLHLLFEGVRTGGPERMRDFKMAVQREQRRSGPAARVRGRRSRGDEPASPTVVKLALWCLNPAVAFGELTAAAHSVILMSGTLSPMTSFASELDASFPVECESPHVVDMHSQVWAGFLGVDAHGAPLTCTYETSGTARFQDAVGDIVLRTCKVVPDGVLFFFPSYTVMDKCISRWQASGLWQALEAEKAVVQEPRGTGHAFDAAMQDFYAAIDSARGCLFLAVCRGKVSEGLDFTDANARAVLVLGVPIPAIKDQQVIAKMRYNDYFAKHQRRLLTGEQWLHQQAFRALNQALGRCIRHKGDYGAILMLDSRFRKTTYTGSLSRWVRNTLKEQPSCEAAVSSMASFFQRIVADPPPKVAEAAQRVAAAAAERKLQHEARAAAAAKQALKGAGRAGGKGRNKRKAAGAVNSEEDPDLTHRGMDTWTQPEWMQPTGQRRRQQQPTRPISLEEVDARSAPEPAPAPSTSAAVVPAVAAAPAATAAGAAAPSFYSVRPLVGETAAQQSAAPAAQAATLQQAAAGDASSTELAASRLPDSEELDEFAMRQSVELLPPFSAPSAQQLSAEQASDQQPAVQQLPPLPQPAPAAQAGPGHTAAVANTGAVPNAGVFTDDDSEEDLALSSLCGFQQQLPTLPQAAHQQQLNLQERAPQQPQSLLRPPPQKQQRRRQQTAPAEEVRPQLAPMAGVSLRVGATPLLQQSPHARFSSRLQLASPAAAATPSMQQRHQPSNGMAAPPQGSRPTPAPQPRTASRLHPPAGGPAAPPAQPGQQPQCWRWGGLAGASTAATPRPPPVTPQQQLRTPMHQPPAGTASGFAGASPAVSTPIGRQPITAAAAHTPAAPGSAPGFALVIAPFVPGAQAAAVIAVAPQPPPTPPPDLAGLGQPQTGAAAPQQPVPESPLGFLYDAPGSDGEPGQGGDPAAAAAALFRRRGRRPALAVRSPNVARAASRLPGAVMKPEHSGPESSGAQQANNRLPGTAFKQEKLTLPVAPAQQRLRGEQQLLPNAPKAGASAPATAPTEQQQQQPEAPELLAQAAAAKPVTAQWVAPSAAARQPAGTQWQEYVASALQQQGGLGSSAAAPGNASSAAQPAAPASCNLQPRPSPPHLASRQQAGAAQAPGQATARAACLQPQPALTPATLPAAQPASAAHRRVAPQPGSQTPKPLGLGVFADADSPPNAAGRGLNNTLFELPGARPQSAPEASDAGAATAQQRRSPDGNSSGSGGRRQTVSQPLLTPWRRSSAQHQQPARLERTPVSTPPSGQPAAEAAQQALADSPRTPAGGNPAAAPDPGGGRSLSADVAAWLPADVADHCAFLAAHVPELQADDEALREAACNAIFGCFSFASAFCQQLAPEDVLPQVAAKWHTRLPQGLVLLAKSGPGALAAYTDFVPGADFTPRRRRSSSGLSGGGGSSAAAALRERRRSITDLFTGDPYAADAATPGAAESEATGARAPVPRAADQPCGIPTTLADAIEALQTAYDRAMDC